MLAANLNLRVCSLRYLFGILFSHGEKSCQQGDLEPNGREMASMRGEGQEPKSRAARSRISEAPGQFYFGLLLSGPATCFATTLALPLPPPKVVGERASARGIFAAARSRRPTAPVD